MRNSIILAAMVSSVVALAPGLVRAGPDEDSGVGNKVAYLGVATAPMNPMLGRHLKLRPGTGVAVEMVDPKSPAAGQVETDDVLVDLDGQLLINPDQFTTLVRLHKPGDEVNVKLLREGDSHSVKIKLGKRDLPPQRPMPGDVRGWNPDDLNRMLRQYQDSMRQWHGGWPMQWDDEGDVTEEFESPAPPPRDGEGIVSYSASATVQQDGMTATLNDTQGKKTFKVTDDDGKVLYDGQANSDEDLKKMPDKVRDLYEEMSGNLNIKVDQGRDRPDKQPAKPKRERTTRSDLRV